MVSADERVLTKLFNFLILADEKDRAIVTASGSPSGMATTITVTAIMKVFKGTKANMALRDTTNGSTRFYFLAIDLRFTVNQTECSGGRNT